MKVICKHFSELTTIEYHRLLAARVAIFVVEQECPYQEVDRTDLEAWHLWLEDEEGHLVAYARIYQEATIHFGRVLVVKEYRQRGLGNRLVEEVLTWIHRYLPKQPIVIGAQAHLQAFYAQFGFEPISETYLEDDIPHIDMEKKTSLS